MAKPSVPKPIARLVGVSRRYRLGKTEVPALTDISLDIGANDFLVLAGPSGSGKTTLLNLIGLIDKPSAGSVWMNGEDTTPESLNSLAGLRRDRIGYIFQTFNLVPVLSIFENVEYPLILRDVPRLERRKLVERALDMVGLAGRLRHRPRELSGGEQQRASIARAIVKKPRIVLADEPTANLDSGTGLRILELMRTLHREEDVTFVFSSHDPRIIAMGLRVVCLQDGRIVDHTEN
ncbi:MAG: ABC transporter ATP-binding protein [Candidatus Aminicenantales bacterium]